MDGIYQKLLFNICRYLLLLVRGRNLGYPFVSGRDVNVGIADMEEENLFYNPYILYRKVILV